MELVRVTTRDSFWLEGAFSQPADAALNPLPVDACLLVHGTGSNFYAPGVLDVFSQRAQAVGIATLRVNTRGHDGISSISGDGESMRGGATYENVAECRLDLAAWIDFLQQRGYSRIALCGHSMGGVKSAYTLAHDVHLPVKALVLISSPRFHHQTFIEHPAGAAFRADYATALEAVRAGRPEQLLAVKQPLPFLATAAGFLDKYGPADSYDFIQLVPRVACPVLYVLGTKSMGQSIGFANLDQTLTELARQHSHIRLSLVDGANINYAGMEEKPFEHAWAWLQATL